MISTLASWRSISWCHPYRILTFTSSLLGFGTRQCSHSAVVRRRCNRKSAIRLDIRSCYSYKWGSVWPIRRWRACIEREAFPSPKLHESGSGRSGGECFSWDDFRHEFHDKDTRFIPLVDSLLNRSPKTLPFTASSRGQEGETGLQRAFQRVGFAGISPIDGNVAGSGFRLKNWKPLPWPEEELQHVVIG
jgi:hypothetical protein